MKIRATMVKSSGRRLMRLPVHSALNSSLWLCFITMARRKGEMSTTVTRPHTPLAHQWGSICRMKGRKKVNMRVMVAVVRML